MNVLPYEVKRAHWRGTWDAIRRFRQRAVRIGEPSLRDMTPARFDIMWVAWRADWHVHERRARTGLPPLDRQIPMSDLRHLLGLAAATISRTAHRLAELLYVRIVRDETDRRSVNVVLTDAGEKLLRLAVECIKEDDLGMRDRIGKYIYEHEFDGLSREEPGVKHRVLVRLGDVVDRWRGYARFFGCEAVPIYDTRVVLHMRPFTVSVHAWAIEGHDPRSRIMNMNHDLMRLAEGRS